MFALAIGIGTKNIIGEWLEAYFPYPFVYPDENLCNLILQMLGEDFDEGRKVYELDNGHLDRLSLALLTSGLFDLIGFVDRLKTLDQPRVAVILAKDEQPSHTLEVYLKLHLLSHRFLKPHELNLTGIFSILPNVAWTSKGPIDARELKRHQIDSRLDGTQLEVFSVDKFPKLANYVVPSGVRIADTARVRLGAYLGEGTTVMHEGFVNFNAGTLGVGMIEGRISAGVIVGDSSDLGGGCSTMGTLSGGNSAIISVGRECLIGANAGIGISLGDRCTVESGLYVTAGTKVHLYDNTKTFVKLVKARDLSGSSDILFRRNSTNGAVEAICNKTAIKLNEDLHKQF